MGDTDTAVRVLTAAFADDPLARWLLPGHPAGAAADIVFGPLVHASSSHGELAVAPDATAAAVWLPRAADPPERDQQPIPEALAHLRAFMELTEARHPTGTAHLYLVLLGVVPGAQGRGLGGALLRERLGRADAAGLPAYLEATSRSSRALYERHGFRDTGDPIHLPDGPTVWPMWRPARP
ncbi:acetyltransferase (GNAT) family protein [Pseudonocardia hierapolitana]|uniref:Acetyltransferase (GNAT) family protein n=1 Tax=Pseudonocardia hierapolitana TaxID=1128676 RepID=A0A561SUE3_9PSEU|nr:GNAT family N-acetyltransferase [Pseudonocardia hierapolitana]TWF78471.1 acetyltransferase (GNAT) family protein [Pseudonocardia hierapolitana]